MKISRVDQYPTDFNRLISQLFLTYRCKKFVKEFSLYCCKEKNLRFLWPIIYLKVKDKRRKNNFFTINYSHWLYYHSYKVILFMVSSKFSLHFKKLSNSKLPTKITWLPINMCLHIIRTVKILFLGKHVKIGSIF